MHIEGEKYKHYITKYALGHKRVKVPSWTKNRTLDTIVRQLEIWGGSNGDVLEDTQFQDLVASLKLNKEIKGLEKYISENVLTTLNTQDKQIVKEVIKCLEEEYGKTRLEKLEELVTECLK